MLKDDPTLILPPSARSHGRVPAGSLPRLLGDLASEDLNTAVRAFYALETALLPDGALHGTGPLVIPLLLDLFDCERPVDKTPLWLLLAGAASGPLTPRSQLGPTGDPLDEVVSETRHGRIRELRKQAASAAVGRALATLEESPSSETRAAAAYFLTGFSGWGHTSTQTLIVDLLIELLAEEPMPSVRASMAFALGGAALPAAGRALGELSRDDKSPLVRLVAAMVLGRKLGHRCPAELIDVLVGALIDPAGLAFGYERLPWRSSDLSGDLAAILRQMGPAVHARLPLLGAF